MAAGGGELEAGEGGGGRGRGWDGMSAHGGETSASSALYILGVVCLFIYFGFVSHVGVLKEFACALAFELRRRVCAPLYGE